jgi:hypothetical protein
MKEEQSPRALHEAEGPLSTHTRGKMPNKPCTVVCGLERWIYTVYIRIYIYIYILYIYIYIFVYIYVPVRHRHRAQKAVLCAVL